MLNFYDKMLTKRSIHSKQKHFLAKKFSIDNKVGELTCDFFQVVQDRI